MKTSKLIALYKGTDGAYGYREGTIYILSLMPSREQVLTHPLHPLSIHRIRPWYKFLAADGYRTYTTWDEFSNDWTVLEEL